MFLKKSKLLIGASAALLILNSCFAVSATGGYTIPGADTEHTSSADTTEGTSAPADSDTAEPSGEAARGNGSQYTIPGASADPRLPSQTGTMSDTEYLSAITLAFVDGIYEVTPKIPEVELQAAAVRVPEKRTAFVIWYINGEVLSESELTVSNGRMTSAVLSVPFDQYPNGGELTVTLELKAGGAIRRIKKNIIVNPYTEPGFSDEAARVFEMIQPVEIEATVKYNTNTYTDGSLNHVSGSLPKGASVYYMDHSGEYSAHVWIPEESKDCWVPYYSISISNKDYTVYEDFSDGDKEIFVNAKGYESETDYLIWINLQRQKVNLFQGSKGNWKLIRTATCSSGKNTTPTPAGVMTYCAYENGWFHDTYYVKPVLYMNLNRGIAMHSILFNPNGTVQDGTQGRPVSHGCVRMKPEDIRYLADYVPQKTTVVVF